MKARKQKKSFIRRIHDAHTGILSALGSIPSPCQDLALAKNIIHSPLVTSGEVILDNTPEFTLHQGRGTTQQINHQWPTRELCHVKAAWLTGDQGHVFLTEDSYLDICPSHYRLDPKKIRRPIRSGARKMDFPVFHLTGRDHENHGHFLLQHLPRWIAARKHLNQVEDLRILVPPGHLKWQRRYLELFGLGSDRIIEGSPGTIFCSSLYYVPMLWGPNLLCEPNTLAEIAKCFHDRATITQQTRKAVWISREDAPDKKLLNEKELVEFYRQEIGAIDLIILSATPLQEQIDIIGNANLIIGAQGQGLTTALFAKNSSLIILEAGEQLTSYGWCSAYRDMAIITGNRSVRMFSGQGRDEQGSWIYPLAKFSSDIAQALQTIAPVH